MRILKTLCAGGGAALLVLLANAPGRADARADALLREVEKATGAAQTLTANLTLTQSLNGQTSKISGKARLKRPNLAYLQLTGALNQTVASDGKTLYVLMADKQYIKRTAPSKGEGLGGGIPPLEIFFNPASLRGGERAKAQTRYLGQKPVGGQICQIVEMQVGAPASQTFTLTISPAKLVTHARMVVGQSPQTMTLDIALNDLKVNAPLSRAAFAYKLPKTARLFQAPQNPYEASLLPVGKSAPKFILPTPNGGQVALEKTLKQKKAVLVNFWFYG